MAGARSFDRSSSSSRTALLRDDSRKAAESSNGEASLRRGIEALNVSRRPARTARDAHGGRTGEESEHSGPGPSGCLNLYAKGGGCRVCACEEFDADGGRRRRRRRRRGSSATDECVPHGMAAMGVERAGVECFSHRVAERLWWRSSRKGKAIEPPRPPGPPAGASLPDDVLESILVRLPFASLMAARCVCRKWRNLTAGPHFLQMRRGSARRSSWLLLFGVGRGGRHSGEVHALDVSSDRWHRIRSDMLRDRFLFSVANAGTDVYIVGGCSSYRSSSMEGRTSSFRTHKEVLVFSPVTGSWRRAASMRSARSRPVLGVFEGRDALPLNPRTVGVSGNPPRSSGRRRLRDAFHEEDNSWEPEGEPSQKMSGQPKFALIAVGGHGPWDEHLESGEVYDPLTDRWVEIPSLPGDFGAVCSGAVCGGMFYVYSEADRLAGYDLEKGFWIGIQTSRPPPRLREYHPTLLSCGGRLFVVCVSWCERDGQASRREKAVRKLWELDPPSRGWNEVSRHPDAPMDWNAAFVAREDMIYGVEMFSIFGQVLDFLTACHVSDAELKWRRISRKHAAHRADASSCATKSIVALHL